MTTGARAAAKPVTPWMFARLVAGGVAVFASFLGWLALASVFARHGFQWHEAVTALIQQYRELTYPIYEAWVAPLLERYGIVLTDPLKDTISGLFLAFGAANMESVIRDGRPLIWSVFSNAKTIFEDALATNNTAALTSLPLGAQPSNIVWETIGGGVSTIGYVAVFLTGTFAIQAWAAMAFSPTALGLPWWIAVWVQMSFPALALGSALVWLSAGKSVIALLVVLFATLPSLVIIIASAIAVILLVVLGQVVASPFIAWRTVLGTISLFLLFASANALLV